MLTPGEVDRRADHRGVVGSGALQVGMVVAVVVLYVIGEPFVVVLRVLLDAITGHLPDQDEWGALLGVSVSALITAVLSIRGALLLPSDQVRAFRLFKLAVWCFIKDRRAVKERMTALLAEDPPSIIGPAHGPAVTTANVAAETRTQIAKL